MSQLVEEFSTQHNTAKTDSSFSKTLRWIQAGVCVVVIHYNIGPLFTYKSCKVLYTETDPNLCGLPEPIFLPYDYDYFPVYHVTYVAELLTSTSLAITIMYTTSFCCGTIRHVIDQLRTLRTGLREIGTVGRAQRIQKLERCIRHHVSILE